MLIKVDDNTIHTVQAIYREGNMIYFKLWNNTTVKKEYLNEEAAQFKFKNIEALCKTHIIDFQTF